MSSLGGFLESLHFDAEMTNCPEMVYERIHPLQHFTTFVSYIFTVTNFHYNYPFLSLSL